MSSRSPSRRRPRCGKSASVRLQIFSSAAGTNAASAPYLFTSSCSDFCAGALRAADSGGAGKLDGRRDQLCLEPRQRCRRGPQPQLRGRAVRAAGLDQVVVHLHDDLRARVQQHARAARQRVRRVPRHPRRDPRRLAEPRQRARPCQIEGQTRPSEARPALAAARGVHLRCRGRLRAGRLVEDHVVDDPGSLRPDQRAGDERVLLQLRIEHEAVVVVDPAAGRVRHVGLARRDGDRPARPGERCRPRRGRVPVGRVPGRCAARRPAGKRRQLGRGEPAHVASDDRGRVVSRHPRRHQPGLRHPDDARGVRLRLRRRRQRERRDSAEAMA